VKIWIVYSDYGMNGAEVHGAYSVRPNEKDVRQWASTDHYDPDGSRWRPTGYTGYGGTFIEEFEVDSPLPG